MAIFNISRERLPQSRSYEFLQDDYRFGHIFAQLTDLFNPYEPGPIDITLSHNLENFDQVFDCQMFYAWGNLQYQRKRASYTVKVLYKFRAAAVFKTTEDRDLAAKHLSLP